MSKYIGICILVLVFFIVQGCESKEEKEKEAILKKSSEVTIEYFKEEEKMDVVITDADFSSAIGATTVFVHGHVKGDKKKSISSSVDYEKDYKIESYGYDGMK